MIRIYFVFLIFLITGKTRTLYESVLSKIKDGVRLQTLRPWNPPRIIVDFEYGLIKAVRSQFRRSEVCGC